MPLTPHSIGKTVNQRVTYNIGPKDTIDDDEIKEEIDVDESDEDGGNTNDKQENLRKKFMEKMGQMKSDGRQSKTSGNRRREAKSKRENEANLRMSNKRVNNIKLLALEVDAIDDDSDEEDFLSFPGRR
jgi:hypothetical protein